MTKKNLFNEDAQAKFKKLAEGIDFAMLATNLNGRPIHMVPMSTKKVDDDGKVLFLSGKDSEHNKNIAADINVHLIYSNAGSMQFLNVFGQATISTDRELLKSLYGKADEAWFDGLDDPNLTALIIEPSEAFYWDPKNNKLITLAKMSLSAITGSEPDLMDQGELNIKK